MTAEKSRTRSAFDHYVFAVLLAVELLMSFTFLGYIHIHPISFTTAYIPILITGCLLGPIQSTIIGMVFGAASMYKASASYVSYSDAVFSPFSSGEPVGSLLLSVGTRALFGLLIGLGFMLAKDRSPRLFWIGCISALGPKAHAFLVYTTMGIFFPELGYNYRTAFCLDRNDIALAIFCSMVVMVLWKLYQSHTINNIRYSVDQNVHNPYISNKIYIFFIVFEFILLCMAVLAAVYFSHRASYMLQQYGVPVSDNIVTDLFILQIQFLIALISLSFISFVLLMTTYKYMSYRQYVGELDALTGVMGRRMFLYHCQKLQEEKEQLPDRTGWFLFIDADYFKRINDTLGHSTGDMVLKAIAAGLNSVFGEHGKSGRMGGDEFAVIIEKSISEEELRILLDIFLNKISSILPNRKVSCSIGVCQFSFTKDITEILTETDDMLYMAKNNGRARYEIKTLGV